MSEAVEEFVSVRKRPNKTRNSRLKSFEELLQGDRHVIKSSSMFHDLCGALEPYGAKIDRIRCLAIGGFHETFPARYQLALLLELVDYLAHDGNLLVSIYDPVFSDDDKAYITAKGQQWTIDENSPWRDESDSTLFFLPHAPLDLSEVIVASEKPKLWLANNVIQHSDRYTKLQLHEKYPLMSKLVNCLSLRQQPPSQTEDQFAVFVSKKSKKKRAKNRFQEPEINYADVCSYFSECKVLTDFDNGILLKEQPWVNSFSDLTLHLIE